MNRITVKPCFISEVSGVEHIKHCICLSVNLIGLVHSYLMRHGLQYPLILLQSFFCIYLDIQPSKSLSISKCNSLAHTVLRQSAIASLKYHECDAQFPTDTDHRQELFLECIPSYCSISAMAKLRASRISFIASTPPLIKIVSLLARALRWR